MLIFLFIFYDFSMNKENNENVYECNLEVCITHFKNGRLLYLLKMLCHFKIMNVLPSTRFSLSCVGI